MNFSSSTQNILSRVEVVKQSLNELRKKRQNIGCHFNKTSKLIRKTDLFDLTNDLKKLKCVHVIELDWLMEDEFMEKNLDPLEKIYQSNQEVAQFGNNLLIKNYFELTGEEKLCEIIRTGKNDKFKYSQHFNFTCKTQLPIISAPLNPYIYNEVLNYKDPVSNLKNHTPLMYVLFNGSVDSLGQPSVDGYKIWLDDCLNHPSNLIDFISLPLYDEIFTISQYWGTGYFHKMVEDVPKVTLFRNFLVQNPTIFILVPDKSQKILEIMEIFGIDKKRLITGNFRAKILYVPKVTKCGRPSFLETQLTNFYFRQYAISNLYSQKFPLRNKIIIVNRNGANSRRLLEHKKLMVELEPLTRKFGFQLLVHENNPGHLNKTLVSFMEAVVVVGPHGAGLSNILFSQPGTLVIEVLTKQPNLCYQRLSYVLGQRWYGVLSNVPGEGVLSVNVSLINDIISDYLKSI